jgi:signal transduction histidine kinase
MLSHELRNPLAPIRSSLALLDRVPPGSEAALRARAILGRQIDHMARVVDDLLDVTRIASGKVHLRRELVDLTALVRRTTEDYGPSFDARRIVLEYQVSASELLVDADATRLVQVISNLLGNSIKFTPPGGRVEVRLRREGHEAALSVRDSGMGIEREVRAHLFQPFVQAPQAPDRPQGGLGLGLAIVKSLVELHGGTVEVASEGRGRGATFTVRLPLVPRLEESRKPRPSRAPKSMN